MTKTKKYLPALLLIAFGAYAALGAPPQQATTPPGNTQKFAVVYEEEDEPVFYLSAPASGVNPTQRAQEAGRNLTLAIQASRGTDEGELVTLERKGKRQAVVFVRGYRIATLTAKDAKLQGFADLDDYVAHVRTRLSQFVPAQMTRQLWQKRVLRVFMAVLFALLGLALLRQLSRAFNRAEELVFQKRSSLSALTLLGYPLISGQALGGLLAFGTTVGRAASYLTVVIAALGAVLSQFDSTRSFLPQLGQSMAEPIVKGLQTLVGSAPALILAGILLLALHAGLRVLHLLLDAVAEGRTRWPGITAVRVPVLRLVLPLVAVGATTLLVVALVFRRYHTPFEIVVLELCGAICIAFIPVLARFACGCYLVWRGAVKPGEWIQIGSVRGEISSVSAGSIKLVPAEGGSIDVSPLYAVQQPIRYLLGSPRQTVLATVKRNQAVNELCEQVLALAVRVDPQANVQCQSVAQDHVQLRITVPAANIAAPHKLQLALCEASDRGSLQLHHGIHHPTENP